MRNWCGADNTGRSDDVRSAQEYRAERKNATGLIYALDSAVLLIGLVLIAGAVILGDDSIRGNPTAIAALCSTACAGWAAHSLCGKP